MKKFTIILLMCVISLFFECTDSGSDNSGLMLLGLTAKKPVPVPGGTSYTLTVVKGGTGTGTVIGNGISCGTDCTEAFSSGTVVTLTASAGANSTFTSWSGCDSTNGASCTVSMNQDRTVKAYFNANGGTSYMLTVNKGGTGNGTVTGTGINCGTDCTESFSSGSVVTLTASIVKLSVFDSWSGCDSTSGTSCTVTMNQNRTVTAYFKTLPICTAPTITPPNTDFYAKNYVFTGTGGYVYQDFYVNKTTTFVHRFVSRYEAQAAIFLPGDLTNFKNGNSFNGYALFDKKIGYTAVTLNPGSYYIGFRQYGNSSNNYCRQELDYDISFPASDTCTYYGKSIDFVKNVNAYTYWYESFTIQSGYRYVIDGCNTGLKVWIIPANQLSNFANGYYFDYYPSYSGTNTDLPGWSQGLGEIILNPGNYYIIFDNKSYSVPNSVTALMQIWSVEECQ